MQSHKRKAFIAKNGFVLACWSYGRTPALRHLNQLHLPVAFSMQHQRLSFVVAKDKDVTIAERRFFDRLFKGHRTHGGAVDRSHHMRLDQRGL